MPSESQQLSSNSKPRITLGVTGGIAAYKSAELVRLLQQHSLDVHVVMTRAAEEFVRPLTFASLTGHPVTTSMWRDVTTDDAAIEHISLAQSTSLLLVAPATAHTLARFAHGLADDFLTTLYLATTAPVVDAPAMNVNMWNHPATQSNLQILRERGVHIVAPGSGYLACGMTGSGRLADLDAIVSAVLAQLDPNSPSASATPAVRVAPAVLAQLTPSTPVLLSEAKHSEESESSTAPTSNLSETHDFAEEKVLITAGGTREPIDPVRFIGNRSSGRMGYALAAAAAARGARVLLISAPTALQTPAGCERIDVTTAAEMHAAVLSELPRATIVIKAAAVSDFRPATSSPVKLHRTGPLTLALEPTPDIAADVAAHRRPGTLVIAFAAETPGTPADLITAARAKLERKSADAIVANDVSLPGLGFDSDRNAAVFLTPTREVPFAPMPKSTLASRILDEILKLRTASLTLV